MRFIALLMGLLFLTGCGVVNSYNASIRGPSGQYDIVGRRGALIEGTFPDGAHITADDRGHPDQPSAFSNMLSLSGAALINKD